MFKQKFQVRQQTITSVPVFTQLYINESVSQTVINLVLTNDNIIVQLSRSPEASLHAMRWQTDLLESLHSRLHRSLE